MVDVRNIYLAAKAAEKAAFQTGIKAVQDPWTAFREQLEEDFPALCIKQTRSLPREPLWKKMKRKLGNMRGPTNPMTPTI